MKFNVAAGIFQTFATKEHSDSERKPAATTSWDALSNYQQRKVLFNDALNTFYL